jgi:transcriptional regulator with XRE-family HTH domain
VGRATNPTLRQRQLAAQLREIRLSAGRTIDEVATGLLISTTTLSRLETGARRASLRNVKSLCDYYGVTAEVRAELMELARDSRQTSWWQQYDLPDSVAVYVGLEDSADWIHQYKTSLVPPLLQTEDYARAVTIGATLDIPDDQIEQRVQARLVRQERLTAESPPDLWAIVDEAALHRQVGGPGVMREQLRVLAERSRLPNVTLQVLPLEAGAHLGMESTFTILGYEDPSVSGCVYVEGFLGRFYLQKKADLTRYRKAFDQLRADALGIRETQVRLGIIASGFPL